MEHSIIKIDANQIQKLPTSFIVFLSKESSFDILSILIRNSGCAGWFYSHGYDAINGDCISMVSQNSDNIFFDEIFPSRKSFQKYFSNTLDDAKFSKDSKNRTYKIM